MNWRFFLVLCFFVGLSLWREWRTESPDERRPMPESTYEAPDYGDTRGRLPAISRLDPEVVVGLGQKKDSTGTAFAVSETGWWLTARHVVDQCAQIQLRFPRHRGLAVTRMLQHPNADLALLFTSGAGVPLSMGRQPLLVGQSGFEVGYPRGSPGEVWSTLLGRRRMRVNGRYRTNEPVVAWAERSRRPASLRSLGGLSGGPALDGSGRFVGVLVAESRRRGRLYTAAPASVSQVLDEGLGELEPGRTANITPRSLRERAQALREAPSIAKVICLVSRRFRRS